MLTAEDASNPLVAAQMRSAKAMLDAEERHRKQLAELRESNTKENRALHSQVRELTERVSVSVVAPTGIESDSLASAVCVLGAERGLKMIEALPETAALIVQAGEEKPVEQVSKRMKQLLRSE